MNVDNYNFDFLNIIGSSMANGFLNITGATPEPFDWIGGQSFPLKTGGTFPLTGVHSIKDHGLLIGDFVTLISDNPRYNGDFMVRKIGADDGTYNSSIFCIDVVKQDLENASGTWQLANYAHQKVNLTTGGFVKIVNPSTNGVTYQYVADVTSNPNYVIEVDPLNGVPIYTLKPGIITPVVNPQTQSLLPAWAGWVALGAGVLGLGWILLKKFKHYGN